MGREWSRPAVDSGVGVDKASSSDLADHVLALLNLKRFRGGLVFKAHRLVYHFTLGLRVIKKKKKLCRAVSPCLKGMLSRAQNHPVESMVKNAMAAKDELQLIRCRANMAHIRQSKPDSSLGFQLKVLKAC